MRFGIMFLPEADRDMNDIEENLSQFYASTARDFFDKMKKQLASLETMPYMYPAYEADPFYRRMVLDDYLLFYSVDEKRNLIIVHRIFHSKRDIYRQIIEHRTTE